MGGNLPACFSRFKQGWATGYLAGFTGQRPRDKGDYKLPSCHPMGAKLLHKKMTALRQEREQSLPLDCSALLSTSQLV